MLKNPSLLNLRIFLCPNSEHKSAAYDLLFIATTMMSLFSVSQSRYPIFDLVVRHQEQILCTINIENTLT